MTITLVSPGGAGAPTNRAMAPRLAQLAGLDIGLLSNGKANAEALLRETAAIFSAELDCRVSHFVDKRDASRPALSTHHRQLAEAADFLITAVGD